MADFDFGNVNEAGRIDTKKLVQSYRQYLKDMGSIYFESFQYDGIDFHVDHLTYHHIIANKIVFL